MAPETFSQPPPARQRRDVLSDAVFQIEVEKIKSNPHQPRKYFNDDNLRELASSIREVGIIQPLVVSKIEIETESGANVEYQLIAGERRLLAAKMAGFERVPVVVRAVEHDRERLELAIIENLQRQDLNPVETARAYAKLQDEFGMTQREIGTRIGKSRESVANAVRLLGLPSEIQDALAASKLNESHARFLLSVTDIGEQIKLFNEIIFNNLTTRELRARTRVGKERRTENKGQNAAEVDVELIAVQERLCEILGAPVKVERSGETGKITITFYSPEELRGILEKFGGSYFKE
ncbi:hypothetical protein A3A20_00235 [Candidatus Wolfebacteria bacterium RIFCSPLOWO2_01_FULL_45_19]|uniref:ParB-like N-terminal domain-containing protein n=1 Tax=Candidatus Wolfebacteria bacterium RIFCSPLOWO2_01_FULL_45_19 TaxID=1802557 RepID=A0A1F8DSS4_9BACT|nr:MAG: hypothetical protein A3A20_00235 [Candidatus Wolfebacteria bacterium RIFCSPLOWO2_01_FULL_45_19]